MDTITNALNSAKTAIYGEGDGTTGGDDSTPTQKQGTSSMIPSDSSDDPSVDKPHQSAAGAKSSDEPSAAKFDPAKAGSSDGPSESTDNTGDPTSGVNPEEHQKKFEASGRPNKGPGEQTSAEEPDGSAPTKPNEDLDKPNEDAPDAGDSGDSGNAGDADTGDAGASGDSDPSDPDSGAGGSGGPSGGAGAPGIGGNDGPKPETESHGEGTGEKWEKSTGLAADGGDFDATRPGAGREADRLLQEKGINRAENGLDGEDTSAGDDESASKPALKDRLKDKFHH